jgi:inner membrane protein
VDNVTHTLAGLVAGHAALFLRARKTELSAASQIATLSVSALANNAPDLDFLYRGITPGRLGYLLHHRGHTHTLLAALPLGLLCIACVLALLRLLGQRVSRSDLGFLLGVATLGGLLHVAMDFGNNYGVHPFWPLDDRWFYGDAIFIVEPWLLITLAGISFGTTRRRLARGALLLILAGLLFIAWRQALAPNALLGWRLALLLTLGTGSWLAWMHAAPPHWRRRSGALALGLGLAVQLLARQQARARLEAAIDGAAGLELVSLVATPQPANPLCWSLLAVAVSGNEYVVQQASASAWPWLWPATNCPRPAADTTAPLSAADLPAAAGVAWGGQFRAPLDTLRELVKDDCVARGFVRFARVPFWIQAPEGSTLVGDLRYDRSSEDEFTELRLRPDPRPEHCPRFEPPWRPPLRLLDPLLP